MSDAASHLAFLHDPRLAALATSATPAWLWSTDASRILWSNPVGAAIFGAASPAALTTRQFDAKEQSAAQVARLLGTLRLGGAARLERLRGFGTGLFRALLCSCSRVTLADHTAGVLVVAAEPAGPALTLAERVRRLYDGSGLAAAAFTPDGNLLAATPQGRARLGDATSLTALGAERLGQHAVSLGRTSGEVFGARVTVERLGGEAGAVLVMTFAETLAAPPQPVASEPPNLPTEPPPQEVVAPPTVPAEPAAPEAPPVAPDMPDPAAAQPAPVTPPAPEQPAQDHDGEAAPAPPVPPLRIDVPMAERRHPLRFVWQMDANGRFTLGSDEFTEVIGPRVAITLGRPWDEANRELALDPEGQVARAVATHDTWSGITVSWPVDGSADRLKVELSGLPIYDRNRNFLGYRGFGVCRDVDRLATLAVMRRSAHATAPTPATEDTQAPAAASRPAAANVVPFRSPAPPPEPKGPALSPVERNAFHELARQLTARLKGDGEPDGGAPQAVAEAAAAPAAIAEPAPAETTERALLDRIPVGVLVYRLDTLLYANRAFLEWTGYEHLDALAEAGGLDSLFVEGGTEPAGDGGKTLAIATPRGDKLPVEGRLFSVPWEGETALVLMLATSGAEERLKTADDRLKASDDQLRQAGERASAAETALRLAETHARELESARKKQESELTAARDEAERASAAKSDFLAKVSHEIRTPLNSILGFSEVMLEERFGPIGNERYRDYLKDIRASGDHLVSLLNDLLDLSKIEAGRLDLAPASLSLNEVVQGSVALMQPQANRERIIIRTSLSPTLPPVSADARSLRQITLNLLSNSIKFTGAGGQVIVSTAQSGTGEIVLRVRDTGIGMDEKELGVALEPFRQLATAARWGSDGTGLGLPLTKALAEANGARFTITSKVNDGTLVEVAFPAAHAPAK